MGWTCARMVGRDGPGAPGIQEDVVLPAAYHLGGFAVDCEAGEARADDDHVQHVSRERVRGVAEPPVFCPHSALREHHETVKNRGGTARQRDERNLCRSQT